MPSKPAEGSMSLSPDLLTWRSDLLRPAGPLNGLARATQQRINRLIPEKVHAAITAAIGDDAGFAY